MVSPFYPQVGYPINITMDTWDTPLELSVEVIPHWLRRCRAEGIEWMLWLAPGPWKKPGAPWEKPENAQEMMVFMGKSWEKHGKIRYKWEVHRWEKHRTIADIPRIYRRGN
jgi:hypothetical protein